MKLCIVGAGSSRLPLMMASVARSGFSFDEVTLFDIRPDRIQALMPVGLELCAFLGASVPFRIASGASDAIEGCQAMILTIRPGFERQRALDERACLDLGVIGQETTGPAGLAFATRTIPAVTGYCELAERLAPGYLPVIFTNPAGMVTQALIDQGHDRAVGICDSATGAARKAAGWAGIPFHDVVFEVGGLNHLSWTRKVTAGGRDILSAALADREFLERTVPWHAEETAVTGAVPVEYLFYYLRADQALAAMAAEPLTRGEAVLRSNSELLESLPGMGSREKTIHYARYLFSRNDTYMSYALGHRHGTPGPSTMAEALQYLETEIGGYAEVAMELLASSASTNGRLMALNVRNGGSIPELDDDDVVETDCTVGSAGIIPGRHARMPAADATLTVRVKEYERLAVQSVTAAMRGENARAVELAIDALTAHPLVPGRQVAANLVGKLGLFR
ncbi:MAG TPA: hypothetical protein PLC24_06545 [Myxococcota bacterium]|nr:hypothetical protein [Myxococcota bacterium]